MLLPLLFHYRTTIPDISYPRTKRCFPNIFEEEEEKTNKVKKCKNGEKNVNKYFRKEMLTRVPYSRITIDKKRLLYLITIYSRLFFYPKFLFFYPSIYPYNLKNSTFPRLSATTIMAFLRAGRDFSFDLTR